MKWTQIVKKMSRVQLLRAVLGTFLLFHLVSAFRENYVVYWHYGIESFNLVST